MLVSIMFFSASSLISSVESLSSKCSKSHTLAMFSERTAAQAMLTVELLSVWSGLGK